MKVVIKNNHPYLLIHGTEVPGEECGVDDYFGCRTFFLPDGDAVSVSKFIEAFENDFPEDVCIHISYKNSEYNCCIASLVGKKDGTMFYCVMSSYTYEEWTEKSNLTSFLPVFCNQLKHEKKYRTESYIYPNDNSFDVSLILACESENRLISSVLDGMAKKLASCHREALRQLFNSSNGSLADTGSQSLELIEGIQIHSYKGKFFSINIPLLVKKLVNVLKKT